MFFGAKIYNLGAVLDFRKVSKQEICFSLKAKFFSVRSLSILKE